MLSAKYFELTLVSYAISCKVIYSKLFGGFQKMSIMVKKKSRASRNKKIALLVLKHVKTCLMRAQRAIFFNVGIKTPKKHYFLLTFLRVEC